MYYNETSTKLAAVRTFIDYVIEYYKKNQVVHLPGYNVVVDK